MTRSRGSWQRGGALVEVALPFHLTSARGSQYTVSAIQVFGSLDKTGRYQMEREKEKIEQVRDPTVPDLYRRVAMATDRYRPSTNVADSDKL